MSAEANGVVLVTNSGTSTAAVLNFVISQGPTDTTETIGAASAQGDVEPTRIQVSQGKREINDVQDVAGTVSTIKALMTQYKSLSQFTLQEL